MSLLILSKEAISRHFPPFGVLLGALRTGLVEYSRGEIVQPVRAQLTIPGTRDRFIPMPAIVPSRGVMGLKLVCAVPSNTERSLPTHLGMIQLFNLYGELLCQMDAEEITARRTALCSAIATQLLAPPSSRILAVLGAGVQAKSHVTALRQLFSFDEVRIWNRSSSRADSLVANLRECSEPCSINSVRTVEEACRGADIICSVTSSVDPILFREHVKPGAHINVVGASSPTTREIGDDLMRDHQTVVVADCRAASLVEAGDVVQTGAMVSHELGALLSSSSSTSPNYARSDSEITLFKNLGLALEDIITADMIYQSFIAAHDQ